jgi:hypothetical protein
LTKEWAIRKGLNPVLYLEKESALSNEINQFSLYVSETPLNNESINSLDNALIRTSVELIRHSKNYQGSLKRRDSQTGDYVEKKADYRFYDEREWRYVPSLKSDAIPLVGGHIDGHELKMELEKAERSVENERLEFSPSDVRYLIVEDDSEIYQLINKIRYVKSKKYDDSDIDMLMTRIFTSKQIREDL